MKLWKAPPLPEIWQMARGSVNGGAAQRMFALAPISARPRARQLIEKITPPLEPVLLGKLRFKHQPRV
jgi:hypothetical protein